MIKLEAVTKSFGEKKVIENLNFEVKANEIVTLAWPQRMWKNNSSKCPLRLN